MDHAIFQFAILIIFTTIMSIIGRHLKLPLVLAYLLTGVLLSFFNITEGPLNEFLHIISTLGVAFLLFLIGIELKITELRAVGKVSIMVGIGQILFTGILTFIAARFFGFTLVETIVVAAAHTFSSTIIAVKLLNTLGDLNSLYGRISIGTLLVQDFLAILALIMLAVLNSGGPISLQETGLLVAVTFLKFGVMTAISYLFVYVGKYIFGYLANTSKHQESTELFLLGTISWVLAFTFIAERLGLSLEIGAFLAGVSLSGTGFSYEIVAKIKPLRDFFIILFFILLGSQTSFTALSSVIVPVIVFTLIIVIGTPFSVQLIMRLLGYSQRTNFLTSLTLAQIGEFSLIVTAGAYASGLIDEKIVSMTTIVAVASITISSYMIMHGEKLYLHVKKPLAFLARPRTLLHQQVNEGEQTWENHVILLGVGRVGMYIRESVTTLGIPLLMVDYDPLLVNELSKTYTQEVINKKDGTKQKISDIVYGDVGDSDLFESLNIEKAKLVISTISHFEDNFILVEELKRRAPEIPVWVMADSEEEMKIFEDLGINKVIWRHDVVRTHLSELLTLQLKKRKPRVSVAKSK